MPAHRQRIACLMFVAIRVRLEPTMFRKSAFPHRLSLKPRINPKCEESR